MPAASTHFFAHATGQPSRTSTLSAPLTEATNPLTWPPTPARQKNFASPASSSFLATSFVIWPTLDPPEQARTIFPCPASQHVACFWLRSFGVQQLSCSAITLT